MAENGRMFTTDESLRAINDKAKEADSFVIKVMRRQGGLGSIPSLVANLSEASVQHITSPELWLPDLAGGGKYSLMAFHAGDLNRPIAGAIPFNVDGMEPRDVDSSALKKPNWRGPTVLDYPKESARVQTEDMGPLYSVQSPSGPGSGDSATRSHQAWARQPGGGILRQDYAGVNGELFGPAAKALEGERRNLEQARRELDLEKHKAELDNTRKMHDADMRALEAKIQASLVQMKPTGPDPMVALLLELSKQQAEDRREAVKQAAEDRRSERERQERADARFLQMMEKMNEKPKEKDPIELFKVFNDLMGSKKDNGIVEAQMKMMHSVSEMAGQQVSTAMDFVNAAAELQLGARGEEEPAWIKGLDRVMKGVGAMAKARQPPPAGPPQLGQPQLPQQAQQPQPPNQPQQPRPPQQETNLSVIEQVEQAIRAKNPPEMIAKALISYAQDPSIQKALIESGGDFEAAFYKRLGNWHLEAPSNAEYLDTLFAELEKQAVSAGLIPPPEPKHEDDEGEDEEGDEGDNE